MLSINLDDVVNVIKSLQAELIAIGVVLLLAIIITVAVNKKTVKNTATKKLVRSETWIVAAVAIVVAVSMMLFGNLATTLNNLSADKGELTSKTEAAANSLMADIQSEGTTLLQNNDNALPLSTSKVNVFGWASTNPIYGGTGSGSLNANYPTVSLLQGLSKAGIKYNTQLSKFYTKYRADRPNVGMVGQDWTLPEPTAASYTQSMINKAKSYSNTAVVVIARSGGEGADLPTDMGDVNVVNDASKIKYAKFFGTKTVTGSNYVNNSKDYADFQDGQSYLTLSQTEKDMLNLVNENFDNVVLVYNGANAMNLSFINDYSNIKSVLWTPPAGQRGFIQLGKILNGSVNPSAKTSDTFVTDFTKSPWWNNYGATTYTNMTSYSASTMFGDYSPSFVNYVEGIYVGYKYYETASDEGAVDYDSEVQYPFGYGLSYTSFEQKMGKVTYKNGKISFNVTVTNTGDTAGKDVVEVYYNPPYTNGGIEKSSVNLIKFAKTKKLAAGATQTLKVSFDAEDMASYDESGAGAYVLEAGNYGISINSDSHTELDSATVTVDDTITYNSSNKRSSDKTAAKNTLQSEEGDGSVTYLSRADHFANYDEATAAPTNTVLSDEYAKSFVNSSNVKKYIKSQMKSSDTMPVTGSTKTSVQLYQLYGKKYSDKQWDKLLNQLTVDEMASIIEYAGYNNGAISSIGKVQQYDIDGPAALNNNFTGVGSVGMPASTTVACTWNPELATEYGELMGTMAREMKVTGWYAPAMNTHRSQFSGRNFEYFSEDGVLSGVMAANEIAGAKSKGVYGFMKHFALNDQETARTGMLMTWSNEQATREIYLKPFEMSVKDGGATAVMSSFNYIGNTWAGANSNLLRNILRNEWGFRGFVETDYFGGYGYMEGTEAIYGGTDAMLATTKTTNEIFDTNSATTVKYMRESTHNILYTAVNSWMYENGQPKETIPAWHYVYYVAVGVIALLLIGLEWLAIRRYLKRRKEAKATVEVESVESVEESAEDASKDAQ